MSDEHLDVVETPETCDETIEYDNSIEVEEVDIEPEEDALEVYETSKHSDDAESSFARFERNYRARRIRELTLSPLAPIRKKRGPRRTVTARETAV